MRVVGIDPGLTRTGFAVVERHGGRLRAHVAGVVATAATEPTPRRLARLREALGKILDEQRPDVAAVERVFFNANVRTAISVGQASGIALVAAAEAGLEVFSYTPTEVKQSVAGFGGAGKAQVGAMVASLLRLAEPPKPPDAADACALAICHLNRSGLRRAVARALA